MLLKEFHGLTMGYLVQELSTQQGSPATTDLDRLGTITLKVYRVIFHEDLAGSEFHEEQSLGKVTKLAEKSLKGLGLTHSIR